MNIWYSILALAGAAAIIWIAINTVRHNPQAFSQVNLGKSLYTVGLLALMILALIVLCIMMLKS